MKIEKIKLKNFKGITSTEVFFNGKSTVLFGVNGAGKSTVLRAINLLYSQIINRVVDNRFKQGINIELTDISNGKQSCSIEGSFSFNGDVIEYSRSMERKGKKRTHSKVKLDKLNEDFTKLYLSEESYAEDMPLFVNYGVNRLVLEVPIRIRSSHLFDKEAAFEKAIESKIDFRTFFEWFRYREDYENEIKVRSDINYVDVPLQSVKYAITSMFDFVGDLRIERNPLAMKLKKGEASLSVEQLSDGEKCTLAMVGDLARRLTLANPERVNPLQGTGVVLIDEIDLHMHPAWQRKILSILSNVFPNIQFIVTTHSPQVLGELGDTFNIYSLEKEEDKLNCSIISSLIGWDANYILESFMGVSNLNEDTKKLIAEIFELIAEQNYAEAEAAVEKLEKITDPAQEDVVKAKILISRGKRRNESNS